MARHGLISPIAHLPKLPTLAAAGTAAVEAAIFAPAMRDRLSGLIESALARQEVAEAIAAQVVGAGHLLWLAIVAVRNGSALRLRSTGRERFSGWRTFVLGLGVNLTNPKIVLFS